MSDSFGNVRLGNVSAISHSFGLIIMSDSLNIQQTELFEIYC